MLNNLFDCVFSTAGMTAGSFLICMLVSLALGMLLTFFFTYKNSMSKSYAVTLTLLPAAIAMVILMVNGNIGAGVAVAGAFSLVRFRSAAGSAQEIGGIFLAMGAGLATGMGYVGYAVLFTVVVGLISFILIHTNYGGSGSALERVLRITIPEDLNYTDVFEDIMKKYTAAHELISVKTTNMGSLFRLTYNLTLKTTGQEKSMIDELRCRNGNLEIIMSRRETLPGEL